jgi:hypothetical protein
MSAHPSLGLLKKNGVLDIKHIRKNSKHSFKKGDKLILTYI